MENKQKTSLLLFVNSYSLQMETFIYNQIKMLSSEADFKLTVLCHYYPDKLFTIDEGIEVIETNISKTSSRILSAYKTFFHHPSSFVKLAKYGRNSFNMSLFPLAEVLKNRKFDIIHAHFGQNGKLIAELMDAGLLNSKLITQFHGLDLTSKKCRQKGYYKQLQKVASITLVNSQYSLSLIRKLGFAEPKIRTLAVGTNSALFNRTKEIKKGKKLKILFIGRLIPLKGAQLIPEIAHKMIEMGFTDFEFRIIGDGPLRNSIIEKSTAIKTKVKLPGYKSVDYVKKAMEKSHLLIYPGITDDEGREETQGLIVQEAMFMKLPVIVSDIGGVPEAVIDGETGFVCKPGDINDFAIKIMILNNNHALAMAMGEKGYDLAKHNYDIQDIHQETMNIYTDMLNTKNS